MKFYIFSSTGLGNIILFIPAFTALKLKYRTATFEIGLDQRWFHEKSVRSWFGENLEFSFVPEYKTSIISFLQYLRILRKKKFDYVLTPFSGNSYKIGLFLLLINADRTLFFKTQYSLLNRQFYSSPIIREGVHYIKRNFIQLEVLGVDYTTPEKWIPVDLTLKDKQIKHIKNEIWIGIHAGGNLKFNSSRQWSKEKFKHLCNSLITKYSCKIILFGYGSTEREINHYISNDMNSSFLFIENQSLQIASNYLHSCDLFIGNDSGLSNLSYAIGTRTLYIMGPTNPNHTGPLSSKYFVSNNLSCMPCFDRGYSLKCSHRNCLEMLDSGIVLRKVDNILTEI